MRVLLNPRRLFQQAVLAAEETEAFANLVGVVTEAYAPTHPMMSYSPHNWSAVSSFFRRSGAYDSCFSSETLNSRNVASRLQSALSATKHQAKYLAPLEAASFGRSVIDCGSYKIQKYSGQQLDALLENDLRSLFYQKFPIATKILQRYWFITVESDEDHPLCVDPAREKFDATERVEFSPYPLALENAIRRFALFNWERRIGWTWGTRDFDQQPLPPSPRIPFVITISNSLTIPPETPTESWLEAVSGEPSGGPIFDLDENRTRDLSVWMKHIDYLFEIVGKHRWPFIEVASGFLVKGFITQGMESLLWNVASIEALLGERTDAGLTRKIQARLATALGSEDERQKICKLFDYIYKMRCDIVHGNASLLDRMAVRSDIAQARDLACLALIWMLSWLADLVDRFEERHASLPTREQILAILDLAQSDLPAIADLIEGVPAKFPHVPEWLDPEQLAARWSAEDVLRKPSREEIREMQQLFRVPTKPEHH